MNVFWTNATDDAAVLAWSKKVVEAVHASNVKKGLASNEIYTGDAADWQDPIASYPAANIAKLKTIRSKYDPNLVFKNLVPGGFKIPA